MIPGISRFLVSGISYTVTCKDTIKKFTKSEKSKKDSIQKKNKTAKQESSDNKLQFISVTIQRDLAPQLPNYSTLNLVMNSFIGFVLIAIVGTAVSYFSLVDIENIFYITSVSFLLMVYMIVTASYSDKKDRVWSIVFPFASIFFTIGCYKAFPLSSVDLTFLIGSNAIKYLVSALMSVVLGAALVKSSIRSGYIKSIYKKPGDLAKAGCYNSLLQHWHRYPKRIYGFISSSIPINVFFLFGIRFVIKEAVSDFVFDITYVVFDVVLAILRLIIAKGNVEMLLLSNSITALGELDRKRNLSAAKRAEIETGYSHRSICSNMVIFLAPSFINICLAMYYFMAFFMPQRYRQILQLISEFCLCFSDLYMSSVQLFTNNT